MGERFKISHKVQVAIVATVTTMLLFAVGAWAFDESRKDHIAPGVRIGGVNVGDRDVDDARKIVKREVVAPLGKPVTVTFEGKQFTLTTGELDQHADVDGMLDEAVDASRQGGITDRLLRYASGGEVNEDITPRVSYSHEAVDDFIGEIAEEIDRDPVNASIEPSGDSVQPTPSAPGVEVREDELRAAVSSAVASPVGDRTVEPVVDKTQPEVTKKDLAEEYPILVTIDRANYKLRMFRRLKLTKTYPIAVGQAGLETPSGTYPVQDKQVNPTWHVPDSDWAGDLAGRDIPPGPSNPLKARWIGISEGAGIHGTDDIGSLGTAASHGCIRMAVSDVIELYDRVPIGATIVVQ